MSALAARQVSEMAGVWHSPTSPRGYHTTARGQSCTRHSAVCVEGCPRAVARSGVARSTRCHTSPGAGRCQVQGGSSAARRTTESFQEVADRFRRDYRIGCLLCIRPLTSIY